VENPSQSYGASPAIWDRTVLPDIRQARQIGTRYTLPRKDERRKLSWPWYLGYIPRWFTCLKAVIRLTIVTT